MFYVKNRKFSFFWNLTGKYGKGGRICSGGVSRHRDKTNAQGTYVIRGDYPFLRAVADCKGFEDWNGINQEGQWEDFEDSGGFEPNFDGKIPNWRKEQ